MSVIFTPAGDLDVLNPNEDTIRIEVIAWALAYEFRWNAFTSRLLSVAEHSVNCARMAATLEEAQYALLHDAAEFAFKDVPSPIKAYCPEYRRHEANFMKVVFQRYGLEPELPESVKLIDARMARTERDQLLPAGVEKLTSCAHLDDYEPFDIDLATPMVNPFETFLDTFYKLFHPQTELAFT